jgi:hypothetical protein
VFVQALILAVFSSFFSGCVIAKLSPEEDAFLREIASNVRDLKQDYKELDGFEGSVSENREYFSNAYRPKPETVLLFSTEDYWFKISLSKKLVELYDSPQPVYIIEIPRFHKYLKLRIRGRNPELTQKLINIVRTKGLEYEGVNERLMLENLQERPIGRTSRRRMPSFNS